MTNYWNPFMGLSHLSDDSVCVGKYKNGYFVGYKKNYTYNIYRYIVNSDIYSLGVAESFAKEFNKNLKILAEDGRKTKYEGLDEDENLWAKYSKIRRDSKGTYLFSSQTNYRFTLVPINGNINDIDYDRIIPKNYFDPVGVVKEGEKLVLYGRNAKITKVFSKPDEKHGSFIAQLITDREMFNLPRYIEHPNAIKVKSFTLLGKDYEKETVYPIGEPNKKLPFVRLKILLEYPYNECVEAEMKLIFPIEYVRYIKKDFFRVEEFIQQEDAKVKWDIKSLDGTVIGKQVCEMNEEINNFFNRCK